MKFCIISDLHCKYQLDSSSPADTLLISNKPRSPINQHPVASMLNIIEKDKLRTNFLFCLGDLGDKADEQGISSAWSMVGDIKRKLNVDKIYSLAGNHDINSRHLNEKKPFEFIKRFHEDFPTNDINCNNSFWSEGYCATIEQNTMILMINTVQHHNDMASASESKIDKETLESIEFKINELNSEDVKFRVCLLHHHPIKHSNIQNYVDSDSIERGDELLDLLDRFRFNIVIHGHKHQPRITKYNTLTILAAGSFSSLANLQGTGIQNMFHVVELFQDSFKGEIYSWEYNIYDGWKESNNINFPSKIGFGNTKNIDDIAEQIATFKTEDFRYILYEDLVEQIPDLKFIPPNELIQLERILSVKYGLKSSPTFPKTPTIITLKKK